MATSSLPHPAPAGRIADPRAAALRAFQGVLALFFLLAGAASLADAPAIGADFELLTDLTGAGPWLRVAAGAVEVLGAVLLFLPAAAAGVGAVLVGALMAATAAAYVVVLHAAPVTPVVLLAAVGAVAYARRAALGDVAAVLERNL